MWCTLIAYTLRGSLSVLRAFWTAAEYQNAINVFAGTREPIHVRLGKKKLTSHEQERIDLQGPLAFGKPSPVATCRSSAETGGDLDWIVSRRQYTHLTLQIGRLPSAACNYGMTYFDQRL